jgi:lysophospholipase L1-like esterase
VIALPTFHVVVGRTGRGLWWTLLAGGIGGAIVAGLVLVLTVGSDGGVRAAAAQRPAPQTAEAEIPSVTFVGDSWTEGVGARALRGYAVRTGEQLGWNHRVLGVGGSGYSVAGRGSTFAQRIDRAVAGNPDVIVVQGSLNERISNPETLRPAAVSTLARLRAAADPATQIVVLGASYTPGTAPAVIDWINASVEQAADRAGVTFVDVAAEDWTDPLQRGIWADANHPNDLGHQLIADRLVPLLRGLVAA